MSKATPETRSLFRITHRERGSVHLVLAETAQNACSSLGWLIEECHIIEVPQQRHPTHFADNTLYFKLACEVCPYQKAECRKPPDLACQSRADVPDLDSWLKVVLKAHLCDYVGRDLERKDYELRRKWVTIETAIKELTPKQSPAPASDRGRPCLLG